MVMNEESLRVRMTQENEKSQEQAGEAARYLILGDFFSATTAAERAYKHKLKALVFYEVLNS